MKVVEAVGAAGVVVTGEDRLASGSLVVFETVEDVVGVGSSRDAVGVVVEADTASGPSFSSPWLWPPCGD